MKYSIKYFFQQKLYDTNKRKNGRASRALFFLLGLRQAKVIHADPC